MFLLIRLFKIFTGLKVINNQDKLSKNKGIRFWYFRPVWVTKVFWGMWFLKPYFLVF